MGPLVHIRRDICPKVKNNWSILWYHKTTTCSLCRFRIDFDIKWGASSRLSVDHGKTYPDLVNQRAMEILFRLRGYIFWYFEEASHVRT